MSHDSDLIISAIKELGRRVTASDVAARTGLPLLTTTRLLNRTAADCKGTLQVTEGGNVVYAFSPAFESAYLGSALARQIKQTVEALFKGGYFLLRISFGVTLILSLITVAILIIAALIAILGKGSDGGGDSGGGGDGGDFNLEWLGDIGQFFCWNVCYPSYSYQNWGVSTVQAQSDAYRAYTEGRYRPPGDDSPPKQGFVMNCFSYLFGDGNPNENIEEYKWRLIAEHIRRNNGVTTAEELSCYTGGSRTNEDDALPVLVRFDGLPVVTDTGNIIYVFPSMQVSAANQEQLVEADEKQQFPPYLKEKHWQFSLQPADSFIPVVVFASLNFVGCLWLLGHVGNIAVLHQYRYLIDWLTAYAGFFIIFPVIRYFGLCYINMHTALRNEKRKDNHDLLATSLKKLEEARAYAIGLDTSSADNIVYSTDKDLIDQPLADDEWDKRLRS